MSLGLIHVRNTFSVSRIRSLPSHNSNSTSLYAFELFFSWNYMALPQSKGLIKNNLFPTLAFFPAEVFFNIPDFFTLQLKKCTVTAQNPALLEHTKQCNPSAQARSKLAWITETQSQLLFIGERGPSAFRGKDNTGSLPLHQQWLHSWACTKRISNMKHPLLWSYLLFQVT